MGEHSLHFSALVGSRICHDLISPIGAIGNGMELMAMSGASTSPEMALISESVEAANARIRFFRIAYGAPSKTQVLGRPEIAQILRDITRSSRLVIHWEPVEDFNRSEVQLAFLAIQCAEQALPYGGTIRMTRQSDIWAVHIEGERLTFDPHLWDTLDPSFGGPAPDLIPSQVQFLLLPLYAQALGRKIAVQATGTTAQLLV